MNLSLLMQCTCVEDRGGRREVLRLAASDAPVFAFSPNRTSACRCQHPLNSILFLPSVD